MCTCGYRFCQVQEDAAGNVILSLACPHTPRYRVVTLPAFDLVSCLILNVCWLLGLRFDSGSWLIQSACMGYLTTAV